MLPGIESSGTSPSPLEGEGRKRLKVPLAKQVEGRWRAGRGVKQARRTILFGSMPRGTPPPNPLPQAEGESRCSPRPLPDAPLPLHRHRPGGHHGAGRDGGRRRGRRYPCPATRGFHPRAGHRRQARRPRLPAQPRTRPRRGAQPLRTDQRDPRALPHAGRRAGHRPRPPLPGGNRTQPPGLPPCWAARGTWYGTASPSP